MNKTEVKDIIKNRRLQLGLSYGELGKMCGVDKTTVRKWELGLIENMKRDKMVLLSKALSVSPLVLLGIEEYGSNEVKINHKIKVYSNPLGNNLENPIAEIDNPYSHEEGLFFALEVEINDPIIINLLPKNKVYVVFKSQSTAENGEIVAVSVANGNVLIKKFYTVDDVIVLRSPNTENCEPITLVGDQVNEVCILGKFVGLVSPFVK